MALQRLRNDPEAGWELRNRTPLWGPDFLMVSQDCRGIQKPAGRYRQKKSIWGVSLILKIKSLSKIGDHCSHGEELCCCSALHVVHTSARGF